MGTFSCALGHTKFLGSKGENTPIHLGICYRLYSGGMHFQEGSGRTNLWARFPMDCAWLRSPLLYQPSWLYHPFISKYTAFADSCSYLLHFNGKKIQRKKSGRKQSSHKLIPLGNMKHWEKSIGRKVVLTCEKWNDKAISVPSDPSLMHLAHSNYNAPQTIYKTCPNRLLIYVHIHNFQVDSTWFIWECGFCKALPSWLTNQTWGWGGRLPKDQPQGRSSWENLLCPLSPAPLDYTNHSNQIHFTGEVKQWPEASPRFLRSGIPLGLATAWPQRPHMPHTAQHGSIRLYISTNAFSTDLLFLNRHKIYTEISILQAEQNL